MIIQSIRIQWWRFGFELEITAKVARFLCRICEVGISYHGRPYDEGKKIGWREGLHAIWCTLKWDTWSQGKWSIMTHIGMRSCALHIWVRCVHKL